MTAAKMEETAATVPPHAFKEFEWLARIDPAFDDARRQLGRLVWTPSSPALAVKYREIIAAVILGCRAYPSIDVHLRRALTEGATLREVLEGFQTAAILGGFPALHYALPFMIALHEEFGDKILGEATSAAAVKKPRTETRPATGAVSRGMREWAWLDAVDPAFEGAHQDLTALVWTPVAPVLPVKIRELVASAVLAYRAFPTLDGHLRRAVREGASVREAVEAMEVAALPGGFPVIHYALPFLSAIHDEVEAGTFR
ncbi:MAG: carboxymuconolactone decarboxylase family protein [Burkholderiales bacterium]